MNNTYGALFDLLKGQVAKVPDGKKERAKALISLKLYGAVYPWVCKKGVLGVAKEGRKIKRKPVKC